VIFVTLICDAFWFLQGLFLDLVDCNM
jgi:hypothetical protein